MAFSPARTCCTAWLPVSAPSEATKSSSCRSCQRRWAPSRASVCSSWTLPRNRTTSSAVNVRSVPCQRGSACHCRRSSAACCSIWPVAASLRVVACWPLAARVPSRRRLFDVILITVILITYCFLCRPLAGTPESAAHQAGNQGQLLERTEELLLISIYEGFLLRRIFKFDRSLWSRPYDARSASAPSAPRTRAYAR